MRRTFVAAAFVAAFVTLAALAARAEADEGPAQATATRRPILATDTPGPSPTFRPATATPATGTPDVHCPPLDTYCHAAYLPILRRDPKPTAIPSPTPEPDRCEDVIQDGSFEAGQAGPWRKAGNGLALFVDKEFTYFDAKDGKMMGLVSAYSSDLVVMSSAPFAGMWNGLKSATLTYSWWGIGSDPDNNADSLGVAMVDLDDSSEGGLMMQKFHWNQDTPYRWTTTTLDVGEAFRRGHKRLWVWFGSSNDAAFNTSWTVDAVSLRVCHSGGPASSADGPALGTVGADTMLGRMAPRE
jgi:hypothetical protein